MHSLSVSFFFLSLSLFPLFWLSLFLSFTISVSFSSLYLSIFLSPSLFLSLSLALSIFLHLPFFHSLLLSFSFLLSFFFSLTFSKTYPLFLFHYLSPSPICLSFFLTLIFFLLATSSDPQTQPAFVSHRSDSALSLNGCLRIVKKISGAPPLLRYLIRLLSHDVLFVITE